MNSVYRNNVNLNVHTLKAVHVEVVRGYFISEVTILIKCLTLCTVNVIWTSVLGDIQYIYYCMIVFNTCYCPVLFWLVNFLSL